MDGQERHDRCLDNPSQTSASPQAKVCHQFDGSPTAHSVACQKFCLIFNVSSRMHYSEFAQVVPKQGALGCIGNWDSSKIKSQGPHRVARCRHGSRHENSGMSWLGPQTLWGRVRRHYRRWHAVEKRSPRRFWYFVGHCGRVQPWQSKPKICTQCICAETLWLHSGAWVCELLFPHERPSERHSKI